MAKNEYLETLDLYIPAFAGEMVDRLEEKLVKYGDTWKKRPVEETEEFDHQNVRFMRWMVEKFNEWKESGKEINWIDVANEALICWVRENDPLGQEVVPSEPA